MKAGFYNKTNTEYPGAIIFPIIKDQNIQIELCLVGGKIGIRCIRNEEIGCWIDYPLNKTGQIYGIVTSNI